MAGDTKIRRLDWYRVPLDSDVLKSLNQRSDGKALVQAGGYLALVVGTASLAMYGAGRWHWGIVLGILFVHGTIYAFMINGVHELVHGTVFKTKWLNELFVRIFSFMGWLHFKHFNASHMEHHKYTLHPPDDLEVVLPIKLTRKDYFKHAFISPLGAWYRIREAWRLARGNFKGEWELKILPAEQEEKRREVRNWARTLLIGHGLILLVAIIFQWWLLPVVITFAPCYGNWLFYLCNNTQHVGLQDNVDDFRLCCRTMRLNPFVRFLYWQMNYHTEHHMYAAVPCYNLGKLHHAIRDELPPIKGLVGTWLEIGEIMRIQAGDPAYRYVPPLPEEAPYPSA